VLRSTWDILKIWDRKYSFEELFIRTFKIGSTTMLMVQYLAKQYRARN
jgi:hypothetical protein